MAEPVVPVVAARYVNSVQSRSWLTKGNPCSPSRRRPSVDQAPEPRDGYGNYASYGKYDGAGKYVSYGKYKGVGAPAYGSYGSYGTYKK